MLFCPIAQNTHHKKLALTSIKPYRRHNLQLSVCITLDSIGPVTAGKSNQLLICHGLRETQYHRHRQTCQGRLNEYRRFRECSHAAYSKPIFCTIHKHKGGEPKLAAFHCISLLLIT